MRPRLALSLLLLLAPLAAPGQALAQPAGPQPLDRLLPEIRRNHPGQFLDAEGTNRNGAPGYRLKWLTPEGRVMWLDADARTGRVTGGRPDREDGFGRRDNPAGDERRDFRGPRNGDDGDGRFGNRDSGNRRDFRRERFTQDSFDADRFNRPFGENGFRNPSERFGGPARDGERRGGFRRRWGD